MNYSIKIDLSKLSGSTVSDLQWGDQTLRTLCIPLDVSGLFEGEKGVYLSLVANELRSSPYGDSHLVKQYYSREQYSLMDEKERLSIPILGSLRIVSPRDEEKSTKQLSADVSSK